MNNKIAIISILKPVDDTRCYKKMSRSLVEGDAYEIHLIGFPSDQTLEDEKNIIFHPSKIFHRLSWTRLWIRVCMIFRLISIRPDMVICNTHELLFTTVIYKYLFRKKVIYDIQENYFFNLWYQPVFPPVVKHILAIGIRTKEWLTAMFFDHFILAEKTYLKELNFLNNNLTTIENKAIPIRFETNKIEDGKIKLLFSGTISESNGVMKALRFFDQIKDDNISLTIIGHCSYDSLYDEICKHQSQNVTIKISRHPIPHDEIVNEITKHDMGLICYDINPSNKNCMPTKVYEYAAYGLPMLYEEGTCWSGFIEEHGLGMNIDFESEKFDKNELASFMKGNKKSEKKHPHPSLLWESEAIKLRALIDALMK